MKTAFLGAALIAAAMLYAGSVYAAGQLVGGNTPVQTFAPDGTLTTLLTVNSSTRDMTGKILWNVYVPTGTTCYYRLMPTSAKSTYVRVLMPTVANVTRGVNAATPFLNLSGCTAGMLEQQ